MRLFVTWFLADVAEAKAIRSIATTKERKREEWPHVPLRGVDGPDMNKLERLARPKRAKTESKIGGIMLDKSKLTADPFTVVSQVSPELLQKLVSLDQAALAELGRGWAQSTHDLPEDHAMALVQSMADFARQAAEAGKPVLELVVM